MRASGHGIGDLCRLLAVVPLAVSLGASPARGQAMPVPVPPRPPVLPPNAPGQVGVREAAAPGHESEGETIAKCLADLSSDDVQRRRRSVMILGKYRMGVAVDGVVSALRDPDPEVRRSALVSLSEWPFVPPQAQPAMPALLVDVDVHVRRLASSMLPDFLGYRLPIGLEAAEGQAVVLETMMRSPAGLSPELRNAMRQAVVDPDVVVRRNVLGVARSVLDLFTLADLRRGLADADREVRILAVGALASWQGDEAERADALGALAADPDTPVRREAARALGRLGDAATAALERLAEDADSSVRIEAVRALVLRQHPRGPSLVRQVVLDESVSAEERRTLLAPMVMYGADGDGLLLLAAESQSAVLRSEAIRVLGRGDGQGRGVAFFARFLADASPDVRRVTAQVLSRLAVEAIRTGGGTPFKPADVGELLASPHPDVRHAALSLTSHLSAADREALLLDACLDDDTGVRVDAIRRLAMSGTPGGMEAVVVSLNDPNREVVLAAVQGLVMRPSPESLTALETYAGRCSDPAVAELVAAALQQVRQALGGRDPRLPPRMPPVVVPAAPSAHPLPPRRWPNLSPAAP